MARHVVKVVDLSHRRRRWIRVEAARHGGPEVVRPVRPTGASPLGRYLHAHKRLVAPPDSGAAVGALVADADVVFTSFDRGRYADPAGRGAGARSRPPASRSRRAPSARPGPYARGGAARSPTGPPAATSPSPAGRTASRSSVLSTSAATSVGYTAAIAAEAALRERRRTGRGAHVDLSTMESMLNVHQSTFSRLAAGIVRVRTGRYTEVYPLVVRPCRDGYVSLGVVTDAEFDRLLIAIGRDDLVADDRFRDAALRWEHRDALDAELDGSSARTTPTRSSQRLDWSSASRSAKVADVADVLTNPQFAHSGFLGPGRRRRRHVIAVPGNPVPHAYGARRRSRRSGDVPRVSARGEPRTTDLPLDGDRRGRLHRVLGRAERDPDARRPRGSASSGSSARSSRREPDASADATEVVMHYFHLKMNRNKESVVLDLRTDRGPRPRAPARRPRPTCWSRTSGRG